jgi:hypothetical protein
VCGESQTGISPTCTLQGFMHDAHKGFSSLPFHVNTLGRKWPHLITQQGETFPVLRAAPQRGPVASPSIRVPRSHPRQVPCRKPSICPIRSPRTGGRGAASGVPCHVEGVTHTCTHRHTPTLVHTRTLPVHVPHAWSHQTLHGLTHSHSLRKSLLPLDVVSQLLPT